MVSSKQKLKTFLQQQNLATLSTVNPKGLPDAASIYYCLDEAFSFFFISRKDTQKCENIRHQKEVVLTITNESTHTTCIIRGEAKECQDPQKMGDTVEALSRVLNGKKERVETILPILKRSEGDITLLHITPTKARLTCYHEEGVDEDEVLFS